MKLNKIKPRLATLNTNRLPVLETKAGATPRSRGTTWMNTRQRIMKRDGYVCASCGAVGIHDVDHRVPLEQGGADADDNLQLLCRTVGGAQGCHDRKTAGEARGRGEAKAWKGSPA